MQQNEPKLIVELGSGLSTIVLATVVAKNGGRIISIDHNAEYANKIHLELEHRGLEKYVELRVAPLKSQEIQGELREWYDIDVISDLKDIDLVFVDGPPAEIREDIRKPALPFFWRNISSGGCFILDDAARRGEKKIISEWKKQLPSAIYTEIKAEKGALLVEKRSD